MAVETTETIKKKIFSTEEKIANAITELSVLISQVERNAHTVDPQCERDMKQARANICAGAKLLDKWTKRYGF